MTRPAGQPGRKSTGLPEDAWPRVHDLVRVLTWLLYRLPFRVRASGLRRIPRRGPVVIVANHSSLLEPQLIYGWLPRRPVFLMKAELATGAGGRVLRRLGQIAVHRGGPNRTALAKAGQVLRSGGVICVFPEGVRGDGDVAHAEGGAAWLARAHGATVVPLATRGTLRPRGSGKRFRPRVDMLVGEPMPVNIGPGRQGLNEGTEKLRHELAELVRSLDEQRPRRSSSDNEVGDERQ